MYPHFVSIFFTQGFITSLKLISNLCIAQTYLKLVIPLLQLLPQKCMDYKHVPPCLTLTYLVIAIFTSLKRPAIVLVYTLFMFRDSKHSLSSDIAISVMSEKCQFFAHLKGHVSFIMLSCLYSLYFRQ